MSIELPLVAQTLDYTCGAACFESAFRYFRKNSPGEMFFAKELGSLELGHTPPQKIVDLANKYGFTTQFKKNSELIDIEIALKNKSIVFVTWWDEDAGHYSLVKSLTDQNITLMDPWTARNGKDNIIPTQNFNVNWKARGSLIIYIRDIIL